MKHSIVTLLTLATLSTVANAGTLTKISDGTTKVCDSATSKLSIAPLKATRLELVSSTETDESVVYTVKSELVTCVNGEWSVTATPGTSKYEVENSAGATVQVTLKYSGARLLVIDRNLNLVSKVDVSELTTTGTQIVKFEVKKSLLNQGGVEVAVTAKLSLETNQGYKDFSNVTFGSYLLK